MQRNAQFHSGSLPWMQRSATLWQGWAARVNEILPPPVHLFFPFRGTFYRRVRLRCVPRKVSPFSLQAFQFILCACSDGRVGGKKSGPQCKQIILASPKPRGSLNGTIDGPAAPFESCSKTAGRNLGGRQFVRSGEADVSDENFEALL